MIAILKTGRKSLIKPLLNFFKIFKFSHTLIDGQNLSLDEIHTKINSCKYTIISNGNDKKDIEILEFCKNKNNSTTFLYSEKAWFTWSNNIYIDEEGIGNKSFLFKKDISFFQDFNKLIFDYYRDITIKQLNLGNPLNLSNFIVIPLQIDGDSKINIGSPSFTKVDSFLKYVVSDYLKSYNGKILIKKHPEDKRPLSKILPSIDGRRFIDISQCNYKKIDLITKSDQIIGINSTFLMESLLLKKSPIVFGLDIFSNKGIIIDGNKTNYNQVSIPNNFHYINNFLYSLMSRQINNPQFFNMDIMKLGYWYKFFKRK